MLKIKDDNFTFQTSYGLRIWETYNFILNESAFILNGVDIIILDNNNNMFKKKR